MSHVGLWLLFLFFCLIVYCQVWPDGPSEGPGSRATVRHCFKPLFPATYIVIKLNPSGCENCIHYHTACTVCITLTLSVRSVSYGNVWDVQINLLLHHSCSAPGPCSGSAGERSPPGLKSVITFRVNPPFTCRWCQKALLSFWAAVAFIRSQQQCILYSLYLLSYSFPLSSTHCLPSARTHMLHHSCSPTHTLCTALFTKELRHSCNTVIQTSVSTVDQLQLYCTTCTCYIAHFSFPFGSLQSWMFASKCNLPVELPNFFHLFS